jgi:hypothetical protein
MVTPIHVVQEQDRANGQRLAVAGGNFQQAGVGRTAGPVLEQGTLTAVGKPMSAGNLAAGYIPRTFDVQVCSTVELPSVVRTVKGIGPNCPAMLAWPVPVALDE